MTVEAAVAKNCPELYAHFKNNSYKSQHFVFVLFDISFTKQMERDPRIDHVAVAHSQNLQQISSFEGGTNVPTSFQTQLSIRVFGINRAFSVFLSAKSVFQKGEIYFKVKEYYVFNE